MIRAVSGNTLCKGGDGAEPIADFPQNPANRSHCLRMPAWSSRWASLGRHCPHGEGTDRLSRPFMRSVYPTAGDLRGVTTTAARKDAGA